MALRTSQRDAVRLLPTTGGRVAVLVLVVAVAVLPFGLDDSWLDILARAGVAAIGSVGLMILTGYAGQVSLGQAFFLGVGAYVAGWAGVREGWPLLVWLPLATLVGAAIGAAIGPFALRLRGNYLAIVTIGLLFVGEHLFINWESFTGGPSGTSTAAPVAIGPVDFADLSFGGMSFTRRQGIFWLIWIVVLVVLLLARNIVRTRPGRALQAVRDRDVAAAVIGVNVAWYKVGAFAVSSGFAALAGGLFGVVQQYVTPADFGGAPGLVLSITYLAMIIVGGMGSLSGALVGGVLVAATPQVIDKISRTVDLPFISGDAGGDGGILPVLSVFSFNQMLFGLAIVLVLLLEPGGIMALWQRTRRYFASWPFSG